ncbi:hypothetical protein E2C01_003877 [Portunus trituberculatus]|uniref:Uncharacterized protein n=1 Tax=Portunus trituberculatus TaxID=210409 RepID=A0A5B7CPT8_PORTR|nr:hypothetical protein [Portunus trituberculatus]
MLERSSPVQGNHIPSWALPSPAVPCDPYPTSFFTSTTLPSSPSCTSTLTSSFTLASTSTGMRSATSPSIFMKAGWCEENTQQGTSQQLQTLSPFVCGAGASLSCSSAPVTEAPVVSAVKNVLRDKDCDNPLNVLHTFGLDVCLVYRDKCLMQNIYNYNLAGLCTLLVSPVVLPCCGASLELFRILPGTVACMVCTTSVSYSWCSHHIHLQSLCPRNHCIKCWCCKPVFHTHCQRCEQCTRSVLQGQCAECGTDSK